MVDIPVPPNVPVKARGVLFRIDPVPWQPAKMSGGTRWKLCSVSRSTSGTTRPSLSLFVIVAAGLGAAVFILGLPGRIAIARKHPEAEAVYLMGWIGFLAVVPWIHALIWAFKPTDVIDIRYLPRARQRETEAMIARLSGQRDRPTHASPVAAATPVQPPGRSSDVMTAAILVIIVACALFWLVFFKLKLLRLTPGWGFIFAFFVLHLFLVFLIGLRFMTPNSANATIVQRTIQLVPRLPEPTLVTAVLVEENVPVKKDQPLFQFDRRPYEYKVGQIEAQLAEAKQNVRILQADVEVATQKAIRAKVELDYEQYQKKMFDKLATGAGGAGGGRREVGDPRRCRAGDPTTRRWPSSSAPASSTNPRSTASIPPSPTWRRNSDRRATTSTTRR